MTLENTFETIEYKENEQCPDNLKNDINSSLKDTEQIEQFKEKATELPEQSRDTSQVRVLALSTTVHGQAQSKRTCNTCIFVVLCFL